MRNETEIGGTPNSLQTATPRQPHRRSTTLNPSTPSQVTRKAPPTHTPVHALHALHEFASSPDLSTASHSESFGNDSWLSVRKRLFEGQTLTRLSQTRTGVSQIPVEELAQARRILTQISGVLDEQMYHKMGKKEREGYPYECTG